MAAGCGLSGRSQSDAPPRRYEYGRVSAAGGDSRGSSMGRRDANQVATAGSGPSSQGDKRASNSRLRSS